MANKEKTETILSKRLRSAMSQKRMDEKALADAAGLSATAIRKMLTGKTRAAREKTLKKLASALGQSESYFQGIENAHVTTIASVSEFELGMTFGPSIRSALRLGTYRTLWLAYDTTPDQRYQPESLLANLTDREPNLPASFLNYRRHVEEENERLKQNPELGEPFFDGPTFCLSRYNIRRSEDGLEKKTLTVDFSRSRYANNVTAKSSSAVNLRKNALKKFNFLDQPIEWLASGVGVAVVVFCDKGASFIAARRSDREKYRSREWDISVVEGINPVKDRRYEGATQIYIHDAVVRAVKAELGIDVAFDDVNVIGFGVDLEYYQWNFIAYVDIPYTARQVEDFWQDADEKEESMELLAVPATPAGATDFIKKHPVWSCGMAALYFSMIKKFHVSPDWRDQFHSAFEPPPKQGING